MIEQRIRARVGAYSVPAVVHAVQGDTGRVFVFEFEDYIITGNEGASLNCQRPDKSFFTYAGVVSAEDNTVTVALDVEGGALTQEGVVTFQLELVESGLIVCTFRGSIIVEPVVGGEATQEEKDFRDAIQAQLDDKASNAQLAQVADDLEQEILDREEADATKVSKTTKINGLALTEDRVLKSAQFAESVTGEKMLANLLYSLISSWNSGTAQSIDLGGSTYLDSTAVVVNNSHQTLKNWHDKVDYGNLALNAELVASEADINVLVPGTTIMRASSAFTLGDRTIPAYSRMITLNYNSQDCSMLVITPTKDLYVFFRNNNTWTSKSATPENKTISITKTSNISTIDYVMQRYGNLVAGYVVLTVGASDLGGTDTLATGFPAPAPSGNRWQGVADVIPTSGTPIIRRIAIQSNGTLQFWYGGGATAGSVVAIQVSYIATE